VEGYIQGIEDGGDDEIVIFFGGGPRALKREGG
jgi:hypothetical protein